MLVIVFLLVAVILFALAAFDIPKTLPLGLCALALAFLVEHWPK